MVYDRSFFDQEPNRIGTNCEKWDDLDGFDPENYNPMWVADMDFIAPAEVTQALCRRAAEPAYGYSFQSEAAIESMLDYMKRHHKLVFTKEDQIMLPCVITGLRTAVLSFTKEGDKVILQPPVYTPFYHSIADNGREIAECPLLKDEAGRYSMDFASIESACKAGAKMMLLCNPHNPIGRCWTKEELKQLVSLLRKYHVMLVSDEIHEDFVYEAGAFTPILSLTDEAIALTSISKTFNLAGLQQATLFSRNHDWLKQAKTRMDACGIVEGNLFAMTAFEAAYRYGDPWLKGVLSYLKEGEGLFRAEIESRLPKAVLSPLEATYLGWIDISGYGLTTEEAVARCRKTGVRFVPGTSFGKTTGEGFLRINYACSHQRILKAAQQLEAAIKA